MAGRRRAANLASMSERTSHTLVLRLWLDRDCLHGSVTAESGIRREFAGRLGLIGAIDDLLTPLGEAGETPPPAVPTQKEPS
jgi:hypothetical protein